MTVRDGQIITGRIWDLVEGQSDLYEVYVLSDYCDFMIFDCGKPERWPLPEKMVERITNLARKYKVGVMEEQ